MAVLQRSMTVDSAFMETKAHIFNDLINSKRLEWSRVVSVLINRISTHPELGNMLKKNPQNYVVNYTTAGGIRCITLKQENIPLIYYLGGSAYMTYDDIINKINAERSISLPPLSQEAPRTHDWDISIQLKPELLLRDQHIIPIIQHILPEVIQSEYLRLNGGDNYFDNFENISTLPALEHGEKLLLLDIKQNPLPIKSTFERNTRDKIELSFVSNDVYINFRLNLVARIGSEIKKNHIIELIFWKKGGEHLRQDISQLVKIN